MGLPEQAKGDEYHRKTRYNRFHQRRTHTRSRRLAREFLMREEEPPNEEHKYKGYCS